LGVFATVHELRFTIDDHDTLTILPFVKGRRGTAFWVFLLAALF
jgi:hypothetical protein